MARGNRWQEQRQHGTFRAIRKAASIDMNVLILGETGAGKELVARAIHRHSSHAKCPFLARNCSQVPETLAESEIFGYAPKSGISGADPKGAKGWFEAADKGTLFLDEIHRLNHSMQDKFLRVLQDKVVSRIGSQAPIQVDATTSANDQDMQKAVREGAVREPFYFRFGMQVHVPPRRQRKEDIPLLAYHFLDKYARKSGPAPGPSHTGRCASSWNRTGRGTCELEYAIKAGVAKNQEILFSWVFEDQLRHAIRRAPRNPCLMRPPRECPNRNRRAPWVYRRAWRTWRRKRSRKRWRSHKATPHGQPNFWVTRAVKRF